MRRERVDRRVRRTRTRLKEALLELLAVKRYEAITIREITDRADVGRSTFYSHYDSKEDLLFSGFDEWLLGLPTEAPTGGAGARHATGAPSASADGDAGARPATEPPPHLQFSLPLLRHVRSQERFFRNIMVRGSSVRVRRRVTELLAAVVGLELERIAGVRGGGTNAEATAHALAGAWVALVAWWLESGRGFEAEDVDRVYQRIARHGAVPPHGTARTPPSAAPGSGA